MYNQRKVVLIIEDSPTQAAQTSALLEEAGVSVLVAVNGMMGLRLAGQVHPDLVILDINLPDIDGYVVCERLKQAEDTCDIPVIVMSRLPEEQAAQISARLGAVEFIPKDVFAHRVLIETMRQMGIAPAGNSDFA